MKKGLHWCCRGRRNMVHGPATRVGDGYIPSPSGSGAVRGRCTARGICLSSHRPRAKRSSALMTRGLPEAHAPGQKGAVRGCRSHRDAPDDSAAVCRKYSSNAVAATREQTSEAGRRPLCAAALYVSAWAGVGWRGDCKWQVSMPYGRDASEPSRVSYRRLVCMGVAGRVMAGWEGRVMAGVGRGG